MSLVFVVIFVSITIGVTTTNCQTLDTEVILFLQHYGYLNNVKNNTQTSINNEEVKQAISLFQEYYQIPGDGTLNNRTLHQMRKPRCGLPDIPHHEQNTGIAKWGKTHLTWNFHLANANTIKTAAFAFSLWAANSSLSFERNVLNPDILISYRGGIHTYASRKQSEEICSASFDGPGGILAHAFYPSNAPDYTSEIHVDNSESWHIYLDKKSPNDRMLLLQTLTHEIGHSLGLAHSTHEDSIMFAFAVDKTPLKPSIEDILAIQHLYGTKKNQKSITTTTRKPTTEKTTNKPEHIDLCDLQYVDTVLILNHRIFITYQRYVWSVSLDGKKYDGPFVLNGYMNFLPENFTLTAAYQRPSGEIVLFIKNMVYMVDYPSFKLKEGWPKRLSDLRFPTNAIIQTAINTNRGRTYVIFDGDTVAQIDECSMTVIEYQPLQSIFPGIPPSPTVAFRHIDGNLYFANKKQYYKFNEFTRSVTAAGKFDIKILNIECPRDGLLQQLQYLLSRLIQSTNNISKKRNDEEEEE